MAVCVYNDGGNKKRNVFTAPSLGFITWFRIFLHVQVKLYHYFDFLSAACGLTKAPLTHAALRVPSLLGAGQRLF